jgi:hypothetical protein
MLPSAETWYSGYDNFKTHTLDHVTKKFVSGYIEPKDFDMSSVRLPSDIYKEILLNQSQKQHLSLMYSGGVDSECVAVTCQQHNIPLKIWTKRFLLKGIEVNVQDLYYSEKFCRRYNLEQIIVDCDIDKVNWLDYCKYYATHWIAASHFWLLERVDGIPVFGGDVPYPRHDTNMNLEFEPRHVRHSTYDVLLANQGRYGITNMASHTYELVISWLTLYSKFFKLHGKIYCGDRGINYYTPWANAENKHAVNHAAGFGRLEKRFKSIGCELLNRLDFPFDQLHKDMEQQVPVYDPITIAGPCMNHILELYK